MHKTACSGLSRPDLSVYFSTSRHRRDSEPDHPLSLQPVFFTCLKPVMGNLQGQLEFMRNSVGDLFNISQGYVNDNAFQFGIDLVSVVKLVSCVDCGNVVVDDHNIILLDSLNGNPFPSILSEFNLFLSYISAII
jgi:hypothetical protein